MLNQKLMGKTGEDKQFIEDLFAVHLYTGNGSTQTINNGIDLAGKGGMVWIKNRTNSLSSAYSHTLIDTTRGRLKFLSSDLTNAEGTATDGYGINSFNSNGFTLGPSWVNGTNSNGFSNCSWTFRKAPKFFDVVTYTGDGTSWRDIPQALGMQPGFMIIKRTNSIGDWMVDSKSWSDTQGGNPNNQATLNSTAAFAWLGGNWGPSCTFSTATTFNVGLNANASGGTYVAYLFAHDTTTDGLIQCGSFTTDGSGAGSATLPWEPQFVLVKNATTAGWNWDIIDNMRGFVAGSGGSSATSNYLSPNTSNAESTIFSGLLGNSGFSIYGRGASATMIYMAIRRGPMRTPTDGTKVFTPSVYAGSSSPTGTVISSGFPVDLYINKLKSADQRTSWVDRLRGDDPALFSQLTQAEESYTNLWPYLDEQLGIRLATGQHDAGQTYSNLSFRRAPGFLDVVCYTGTGSAMTINHNLGVAPELMIVKRRSSTGSWYVYAQSLTSANTLILNATDASTWPNAPWWGDPNASSFYMYNHGTSGMVASGATYVAYLFASCPGVSKVFSFTGNGSSQTINCGFTNGARLVLIKRTDSTGDWYVWDTARGIVAGNDGHLSLNSTAAEVTTDDTIDPDSTGFIVNQVAATNVNVNGASYIGLAIA